MTSFQPAQLAHLVQVLADAARAEILPRFARISLADARRKTSAFDVVTEADERAEAAIASALRQAHPGAVVVGEEAAGRDPALLSAIGDAELAFIVDPLDGTRNFASGLPLFGVMAAVTVRGRVVAAAIHDPMRGDCACALAGQGAWLARADGSREVLQVASPVPPAEMEAVVGTNFLPEPMRAQVNARLSRLGVSCWFRCAAHEYRLAASGAVHLLFYNKLMPWDHAAGWLLHREAGGHAAHFDGSAYAPTHTVGGLICAPDAASWQAARQALLG